MTLLASPYLLDQLREERQQRLQAEVAQQQIRAQQPHRPARWVPSIPAQLKPHWPHTTRPTSDFDLTILLAKE